MSCITYSMYIPFFPFLSPFLLFDDDESSLSDSCSSGSSSAAKTLAEAFLAASAALSTAPEGVVTSVSASESSYWIMVNVLELEK